MAQIPLRFAGEIYFRQLPNTKQLVMTVTLKGQEVGERL